MGEIEQAKTLIVQQKYKEARELLDSNISANRSNDEFWYLRGVTALKLKNYDTAQECFARALVIGKKSKYYQIKGMAHFEIFEMEEAADAFLKALVLEPDDATTNFFLAVSYLFLDDPKSENYIKKAYKADAKKTKQLLMNFFTLFLKDDKRMTALQKSRIEERIRSLGS